MPSYDPLWPQDVSILWRRPLEFFPTRDQTAEERINALVRFATYATAAVAMFGTVHPGKAAAVGAAVIVMITVAASSDPPSKPVGPAPDAHDASVERRPATCRKPTKDNPFMNAPVTDFGKPSARACPYTEEVKKDVERYFEDGLVREVTDVYHNRASDRQFVTVPVPDNVPDTLAFRNFLFADTVAGCKNKP